MRSFFAPSGGGTVKTCFRHEVGIGLSKMVTTTVPPDASKSPPPPAESPGDLSPAPAAGGKLHHHLPPTDLPIKMVPLDEDKVFKQMTNCEPIRYAAYRTAVKLVSILGDHLLPRAVKFFFFCRTYCSSP